jgi:GTP-binding protein Era
MTRKNLVGVVTRGSSQFVFIDTPGFHDDDRLLNRELRREAERAIDDVAAVLVLIDVTQPINKDLREKITRLFAKASVLFILNKTDAPRAKWRWDAQKISECWPGANSVPVSALRGEGLDALFAALDELSVDGPFWFPEDDMTTANLREIASQAVFQQIMEALHEEIPYQIAVVVESYREMGERDEIAAAIIVNRDSQKGMVIGRGGATLKTIGSKARKALEAFLGRKVRLDLFVKVDRDWINDSAKVREYCGF